MIQQPNYMNKSFLLNLQDKKKKIPYEYGTRWLFFYIYLRFPLGLFFSLGALINSFSQLKENINYETITGFFIVSLPIAFMIFVYIQLRKRTIVGYYVNMVYLVIEVATQTISSSYNMVTMLTQLFIWSIFAMINFAYFYKRKIIFEQSIR